MAKRCRREYYIKNKEQILKVQSKYVRENRELRRLKDFFYRLRNHDILKISRALSIPMPEARKLLQQEKIK